jgi:hypothetical protein
MGLSQPLFVYPNYINCDYFKYRGSKKSEIAAITEAAEIIDAIDMPPTCSIPSNNKKRKDRVSILVTISIPQKNRDSMMR